MKRFAPIIIVATLFFTGLLFGLGGVRAAPMAAITPVAMNDPVSADTSNLVYFFRAETSVITSDTRICRDLHEFLVGDIEYVIDQTLVGVVPNTTTLTLQHTIDGVGYTNGQVLVTNNIADADDLNRYDLYGKQTCLFADVSNSNPITITASILARR